MGSILKRGAAVFTRGQADGLAELAGKGALIRVAAFECDAGDGGIGFAEAAHGVFHADFLDELAGGDLEDFAEALLELIGREAGESGELLDAQRFVEM